MSNSISSTSSDQLTAVHFDFLCALADDHLVLSQRLGEWVASAPDLEEDIAMTNIGLVCLGVARSLYTHAANLEGKGRDENDLAMFRNERQYRNLLLVEQPNRDYGWSMVRQLLFDSYALELWAALQHSSDRVLAGIAAKAIKESSYHFDHSSSWVIRLGDGTEYSHQQTQEAVDGLWRFVGELFADRDSESELYQRKITFLPSSLESGWQTRMDRVLTEATLSTPTDVVPRLGGREGIHTEHLGHLLAEMQWLPRSMPDLKW